MRRGPAKKLGKYQLHHQEREQWRQDAPHHAKHCPLIFLLEVTLHQFLKEKTIIFQLL